MRQLEGWKVASVEGVCCGRIKDIYFDDGSWAITHALLFLFPGLSGPAEVLARPEHFGRLDEQRAVLHLRLKQTEIAALPTVSSELPVCKQYAALAFSARSPKAAATGMVGSNPRLRTAKAVTQYEINVRGEYGGTLEDLIFDKRSWQIRFLTIKQEIERKKLRFHILPQSVERFTWATQRLILRELQPVCLDGGGVLTDFSTAA